MKEKLLSTLLLDNPEIFSIIEDKITGLITSVKVKEHRQRTRAAFDAQQNSTLVQQLEDHNTNNNDAVYGYDARPIQRIHDNHTVEPPISSVDPGYALYTDDDHGGGGNSGSSGRGGTDNRGGTSGPVYLNRIEHQQRRRPPDALHEGPGQLARTTSRDAPTLSKCYFFESTFKPSMQIKTIFSLYI